MTAPAVLAHRCACGWTLFLPLGGPWVRCGECGRQARAEGAVTVTVVEPAAAVWPATSKGTA